MPTWPGTLPQTALLRGYNETIEDNLARFQPEVGPPKLRRRSSVPTNAVSITMNMTSAQVDTLVTFYRTTLKDGSLSFTADDFRTAVAATEYTFTSPFGIQPITGDLFNVSLTLRRLS